MPKQRGKIGKYSKITLQKKFQLLRLSQCDNINLKQTSKQLQINYSTAKTILFQYQKNKIRNFLNFQGKRLEKDIFKPQQEKNKKIATYKPFIDTQVGKYNVKVLCTLNSNKHQKKQMKTYEMRQQLHKNDRNSIQDIQQEKLENQLQQNQNEKKSLLQIGKDKYPDKNQTKMNSINSNQQKCQNTFVMIQEYHVNAQYSPQFNQQQMFNCMQGMYYIPWIFSNIECDPNSLIFNS